MPDRKLPPDSNQPTESAGGQIDHSSTPLKRIGDFDLLSELGRGGMGIVYEARQISLNRRVALKVLPPGLGLTETAVQRFEREARAAAKLHHTNIVPVHAIGEEEGCHFYAMELIEGQPLSDVLRDLTGEGSNPLLDATVTKMGEGETADSRPAPTTSQEATSITSLSDSQSGGRKWFDAVAKLIAEVADGLEYAHGRGVIHRDIKPANLMLSKEGKLCVTDFGLARVAQEPGMTVSGSLMGTPAYMSPEQIAVGRMKLDHRTDIYSLGAVLYELLTHRRPFPGESREEILGGILTKDPRPPRRFNPRIPVDLETICQKAMEKDPDRRYQDAGAFAQDLRQFLQRGLITARRASLAQRAWKSIRRHPTIATAVGLVLLSAVIVTGVLWVTGQRSTTAEVERLLLEGQIALEAGVYRDGMASVEKALSIDPESDRARILKAKFLMYAGNRQMVMEDAQVRLERDPDDWVSHLIVAYAALEWLDVDYSVNVRGHVEALEDAPESADLFYLRALVAETIKGKIQWLDRALELEPNHHHALEERYNAFAWALGDHQEALRVCERVIVARPRSELGYTLRAFSLNGLADYDGAMKAVNRAVELDPGEAHAYWTRGHIYRTNGKHSESILDFTKAIELRPQVSRHFKHRAQAYLGLGEYEKALVDIRRALEINPTYPDSWRVLFTLLLRMEDEDQLLTAARELREQVRSWYDHYGYKVRSVAFNELSTVYRVLGDYEQALSDAARAIELDPDDPDGYVSRLLVSQQLGDEDSIQGDCDSLAALDLADIEEDFTRAAHLTFTCSRPDQALDAYGHVISRTPGYWRAYRERGNLHFYQKHFEEALADYERAFELAPTYPALLNGYAWALLVSEPPDLLDPERALKLALQANERTGFENAAYLDTLALAYHMTDDSERAVETQKKALSLLSEGSDRTEYEKHLAEFEAAAEY